MSAVGHFAAGFAARPYTPKIPLLVLLVAGQTNDLLYFLFSTLGLERTAQMSIDFSQGARYSDVPFNPWSHGLFMSVIWSLLAAGIAFLMYRDRRSAGVMGLVVFSHWVLDFLMHSNLPLFFDEAPLLGIGLENTGIGFIFMTLLDLVLITGGILMYWASRKKTASQDKVRA